MKEFEQCKLKVTEMSEEFKVISKSISALAKSQIEQDIIHKQKGKANEAKNKAVQRVGTVFGVAFGLVGMLKIVLDFISNG